MEPFIGEIRIFAGNYAPYGWAFCNGQELSIQQNTALFAIIGTIYGGDGRTTFKLPDLRGKAALKGGAGPGLTPRNIGENAGTPLVSLTKENLPAHNHVPNCQNTPNQDSPDGAIWSNTVGRGSPTIYAHAPNSEMNQQAVQAVGGNNPHYNMQPYLGLNFIIALQGIFPVRN